jgi:hypothetical protein
MDLNLLIVRQGVNLLNGQEILFVRCKFHIIVAGVLGTTMTFGINFLHMFGMFRQNLIGLAIGILCVLLENLLDDLSHLVLGFNGLRSLLLYTVNAPSFFVKLNQGFAGGVFDLQGFGSLPDGHSILLRQFNEHTPCLRGDRVIMVSFLGICFVLWNFGEHFTKLDYIGFLILNYQYTIRIGI